MGEGLRISAGAFVLVIPLLMATAHAEDFSACWVSQRLDALGRTEQITRCRIAGGDIVDYASDSSVPGRLYPLPGTDLAGPCWYYSSTDGNWVLWQLYSDGDAILGYSSGPIGGGVAVVTGRVPRCTSEPIPATDPAVEIWSYVTEYIHPPPVPELNPGAGDGVTGLETFVAVPVPGDHAARLASVSGALLDVFIEVSAVVVDWGDGSILTYPADQAALSGYPDGIAAHVYEIKNIEGYDITVSYDWTARWRVAGGAWLALAVPNTTTSVVYPVSEIVSVITR
jgi:hypothetical protein